MITFLICMASEDETDDGDTELRGEMIRVPR